MPYGPGAKAEVLSILAFRAYPVNRGFATGRVEVTENPGGNSASALKTTRRSRLTAYRPLPEMLFKVNGLMSAKCVDRISSGGARRRERGGQESQQQYGQGCYRVDKRISRAYIKQECIHQP
jgi:hypothetical protein